MVDARKRGRAVAIAGLLWGIGACSAPKGPSSTSEPSDTGTPSTTPEAPLVLAADCLPTENALRVSCGAILDAAGPAVIEFSAPGVPTRRFESAAEATEHTIVAWGLLPETDYTWIIGERSGTIRTGPLPGPLAGALVEASGTLTGMDAVLVAFDCDSDGAFLAMIDGVGRIVWYEPSAVHRDAMTGYAWDAEQQTVLAIDASTFLEQHVSGEERLRLSRGADFADTLHHDVARWGAYTYLLGSHVEGGVEIDSVEVFEGTQRLGGFSLDALYPLTVGAHTNGIDVGPDGGIVLSLLAYSTVLGIDGDPASPTFLDPASAWLAQGGADGLAEPDYAPAGERLFYLQHDASRQGDRLWVFDNGSVPGRSRALRMAMDDASGTLTEEAAWSFDEECPIRGGAVPLEEGGVLATCATADRVARFEEGAAEPAWTLHAVCERSRVTTRAVPIAIR